MSFCFVCFHLLKSGPDIRYLKNKDILDSTWTSPLRISFRVKFSRIGVFSAFVMFSLSKNSPYLIWVDWSATCCRGFLSASSEVINPFMDNVAKWSNIL